MKDDYIYHVTHKELNEILSQTNINYDLIKDSEDCENWYYQVYYYDSLHHLIAIVKYRYVL